MENLKNKVAIVTGASRGIGASIAKGLAMGGAKVVVNYVGNSAAAEKVVYDIISLGGNAISFQADVSRADQVKALFDHSISTLGKIDIMVNAAGVMINRPIAEMTDEEFDRQMSINVKGVFNILREAALKLSENGSIVNFSTSANRLIFPSYGPYVASKAAVEQLTRVFAKEIGHRKINVNSVSPGPTNTELFTTGKTENQINNLASLSAFNRIGEPEDIAKVVLFLVSNEAKWITGQNIGVNGGMA